MAADRSEFSLDELKAAEALIAAAHNASDTAMTLSAPPPRSVSQATLDSNLKQLRAKRDELRDTAVGQFAESERLAAQIEAEITKTALALQETKRRVRVMRLMDPQRQAQNQSLLESVQEKLKTEKARNKHMQDRFMRLSALVKTMTKAFSNQ